TINANCHYVCGGKIRQAIVVDRKAKKRFGQHTLRRNNESRNTCHRPNRLNLLNWTATSGPRSNFLRKKWVKTGGKTHLLMCGARICGRGQPPLHLKTEFRLLRCHHLFRLGEYFLEKRLKLALFQCCNKP